MQHIRIFDNGGKTFDRYTAVYMDEKESQPRMYSARGMSEAPTSPQGFGQWTSAMVGRHLGKRIAFGELPKECRAVVLRDAADAPLTFATKPERKRIAEILAALAEHYGARATIEESTLYRNCVKVRIDAQRGLSATIELHRDSVVVPWHIWGTDARLSNAFGDVNPHHRRKATHVYYGWRDTFEKMSRALSMAQSGEAFAE